MAEAAVVAANWVGQAVGATLTAAGVSASVALPIAATAANIAYGVSIIALQAGLQYAIDAVNRPKLKPPGSELQFNIDPDYPREMIIGQRLVGGSMVARYSRGSNLYNAHLVIQLADHPCVELSKVYDGGRLVRSTALTHGTRTEITAYSNSGGARVWMTWWDGRPGQVADSDLVTKSAQDPEVVAGKIEGWTSNHKGAGCAYVHVEVQWDSDILTSLPQFQFLVKGAKLYDRRKDTTAGGSGAHRHNDPATWEYSTNAMVAMDHFLLGYKVEADPLAFGIGLSKSEVPYAQFAAAADLCDEDVVTGVGGAAETIKRYAVNGVISAGDYFEEVVEAFQLQMAARVVDLGGRIGILGAEERAVVVSLTEDDLVAGEPLQFADKLQFTDLIGTVTGTFADPANNYQPTAYEPLVSAYAALPDGGEAQATSLVFPYEVHPRRVVRLATAWLERESLQPRLAGVFMPKAWKLEPGDWFEFTSPRLQVTAAKFEVVDIVKNEDFTVLITARAIDPNFLAFSNDNDPNLSVPPDVAPVSTFLDTPTFAVATTTLEAGGVIEPALQFTLTSTEQVAREIVVEYGKWNGTTVETPTIGDSFHVSQTVTKLRKGVLPSTSYKVRAKAKAGRRESQWSDWSSVVTTGATYAVGSAASVPWTGVTDPTGTRPDDNADVTAANTAAAIAGQGDLATTNKSALPFGVNALTNTEFSLNTSYPPHGYYSGGIGNLAGVTQSASIVTAGPRRAIKSVMSGTVSSGTFFDLIYGPYADAASARRFSLPVVDGDIVGASALVAKNAAVSHVYVNIQWLNDTGIYVSESAGTMITANANGDTGNPADYSLSTVVATAPTNARFANVFVRCLTSAGAVNPTGWAMSLMLCRLPSGQTVVPPYTPGPVERSADRTNDNTAAAIISQGAFATLSSAAYGSALLTGFGALAAKATIDNSALVGSGVIVYTALSSTAVRLGTNITRADGSTSLTDALAVTSLGTAAAIAGQGWGATASETAASNAYVPLGENLIINSDWARDLSGWYVPGTTNSGLTVVSGFSDADGLGAYSGAVRTHYTRLIGTPSVGQYVDGVSTKTYASLADLKRYAVRVNGGERVHASMYMSAHRGQAQLILVEFDAAGSPVGSGSGWYGTANHNNFANGNPANAERLGGFVTLNSATRYLMLIARMHGNGGTDPYLFSGWPMVAKVTATQTVAPPYKSGQVDRYSDHTPDNTAAAIASQGDLATTNRAALPFGSNACVNSEFQNADGWGTNGFAWDGNSGLTITRSTVSGKRKAFYATAAGTPSAGTVLDLMDNGYGGSPRFLMPVQAGDRIGASVLVAAQGCTNVSIQIGWSDENGTYLSEESAGTGTPNVDGSAADPTSYVLVSGTLTVPSGVRRVRIWVRGLFNGNANPKIWAMSPMLCRLPSGQTAVPPYSPGPPDPLSDRTLVNTAAAITSQGGLATLNFATIGTNLRRADGSTVATEAAIVTSLGTASAISGQGGLATLSFVQLNSNVRLQDGTTIITDALVVTATGTAAAIAGQGNFATVNFYRQASAPSSPQEGWWWVDTTNSLLKLYTGGTWQTIADITTPAAVATAVAESVFTKNASTGNFSTSGTTIATIATIDANNVPAGGFIGVINAALVMGSYTLSSGSVWNGNLIITEQLQSGGTEHTLHTIPISISDTGGGFYEVTYDGGNDAAATFPKAPVAQNVSGNCRYRMKVQRTSGTNNINSSPSALVPNFIIQRTPG